MYSKVIYKNGIAYVVIDKAELGLDKVDNTSDAEKPLSDIQKEAIASGGGSGTSGTIKGVLLNKTTFTDTSDFTATGFTPTIVGGAIRLPAGVINFNRYMDVNGFITADENVVMEIKYILRSAATGNSYGIAIGKRTVNTYYPLTTLAQCGTITTAIAGPYIGNGGSTILTIADATFSTFAMGDEILLRYSQQKNNICIYVKNLTTGYSNTIFYKDVLESTSNAVPYLSNASKFAIWTVGDQVVDLTSISITSYSFINKSLWFVGDSKTQGYASLSPEARYSTLLGGQTYGSGGDRTTDLLLTLPYFLTLAPTGIVVLEIGCNDLRSGAVTATWQANYISIVNQLVAAGLTVYHLVIPEGTSQAALSTFVIATYGRDKVIDLNGYNGGIHNSNDAVHPNALGHKFIADKIRLSGILR